MTMYEQLKERELEKAQAKERLDEITFQEIEMDFDFYVLDKTTGKIGYAETIDGSEDVKFIVPADNLTAYRVKNEEFNTQFFALDDDLYAVRDDGKPHTFVINKDGTQLGVIDREDQTKKWRCGNDPCNKKHYIVRWKDIATFACENQFRWISPSVVRIT